MAQRDLASVQIVDEKLAVPHTDLLRDSVPRIVTYILPVFATSKKTNTATASYNLIVEQLTQQVL